MGEFGFSFGSVDLYDPLRRTFEKSVRTSSYHDAEVFEKLYQRELMATDMQAYHAVSSYRDHIFRSDNEVMGILREERYKVLPATKLLHDVFGIDERYAACLNTHGAWADVITVQLAGTENCIGKQDWSLLTALLPHWAKAMELYRTFKQLRVRFETILAGLDRLQLGVCIMTSQGEVIIKNEEALRITGAADGIRLGRAGNVILSSIKQQDAFDRAIISARDIVAAEGVGKSTMLTVPRKEGLSPYLVEVMPLRDDAGALEASCRGMIVVLIDPDRTDVISTKGMELLYGLTAAESEVCELIATGLTTLQVAESRNTSVETTKTQIKKVLEKTSTSSRSQLVRLAHHVNLPITKN
ncbi:MULTISPECIES: helix-turn-helix transcriptional regulator [unclassified Thalassospira]|uniref:helix-turn-helix transcriptional regulator n=1 Tax=unclassified Thalassospira TaxID=2648997 RepID=UPI001B13F8E4|nr:helix-turn-helix transcriptional regulator [Thalassospira sp.]MBO6773084.1 helix-turn-helix transcriptional regulator [Thalassospira sp.]